MARNLTRDFILSDLRSRAAEAIAAVPEYETVLTHTNKRDAKGKIVVDEDGVPVLVEKRLLKRAVVAAEWADRLKPHEEKAHDRY